MEEVINYTQILNNIQTSITELSKQISNMYLLIIVLLGVLVCLLLKR